MVDACITDTASPNLQTPHDVEQYSAGKYLTLDIDDVGPITVTVIQHLSSTTSQVFTVKTFAEDSRRIDVPLPFTCVMKIFDTRFLKHRTTDNHPWSSELEAKASQMPAKRHPDGELIHPHHVFTDDPLEWELFYQNVILDSFNTEKRAYSILSSFQGRFIPKFYASGTLRRPPGERAVRLPILLLEHLPGKPLESFDRDASHITRDVYSELHNLLLEFKRNGIAHTDLHPRNIHLAQLGPDTYRPVVLDFGSTIIREGMMDEEWEQEYAELGDLDALKVVFRRLGFEYGFEDSVSTVSRLT